MSEKRLIIYGFALTIVVSLISVAFSYGALSAQVKDLQAEVSRLERTHRFTDQRVSRIEGYLQSQNGVSQYYYGEDE